MPRAKEGFIRRSYKTDENGKPVLNKKGEPTIIKMEAFWGWVDSKGNRRTKSKVVKNVTEAKVFFDERRSEEADGVQVLEKGSMTVAKFAEIYEKTYLTPAILRKGLKVHGLKSNIPRQCALKQVVSYFGKRKLNSIEDTDIVLYKQDRLNATLKNGNPYAIATINKELAEMRQLMKRAKKRRILKHIPDFDGIISKKAETKRARVLKGDEEDRLLEACELPDKQGRFMRLHVRPILICALDTAMRRGEILQLQWRDVRFDENSIKLRAETTKTEEAREIPISKRLLTELQIMYADQNPTPSDKVFRRKILGRHAGKKISEPYYVDITDNFQSAWEGIKKDAKVEEPCIHACSCEFHDLNFHDLRHHATTMMLVSGMPESLVRKITGHKDLSMFERYVNPDHLQLNQAFIHFENYRASRFNQHVTELAAVN